MRLLRRYGLSIVLMLVALTLALTADVLVGLRDTNARLAANVNAQVANRAMNVRTWCGSINQGRDYDRLFVRRTTHGRVRYMLADLPCTAIADATLKSARHK